MSYEETLRDLKEEFGKQKLLNVSDIAPYLGKSEQALASLRYRNKGLKSGGSNILLNPRKFGGRLVVSIYDLARYISGEGSATSTAPKNTAPAPSAKRKTPAGSSKRQTTGVIRPPSLGKIIALMTKEMESHRRELEARQELVAMLEALELDRKIVKKAPPALKRNSPF